MSSCRDFGGERMAGTGVTAQAEQGKEIPLRLSKSLNLVKIVVGG